MSRITADSLPNSPWPEQRYTREPKAMADLAEKILIKFGSWDDIYRRYNSLGGPIKAKTASLEERDEFRILSALLYDHESMMEFMHRQTPLFVDLLPKYREILGNVRLMPDWKHSNLTQVINTSNIEVPSGSYNLSISLPMALEGLAEDQTSELMERRKQNALDRLRRTKQALERNIALVESEGEIEERLLHLALGISSDLSKEDMDLLQLLNNRHPRRRFPS